MKRCTVRIGTPATGTVRLLRGRKTIAGGRIKRGTVAFTAATDLHD